eukprot:gene11479-34195_t
MIGVVMVDVETKTSGALLLGTTIKCCCTRRLVSSFPDWGMSLLEFLKKETEAGLQRECCNALSALFNRLHEVIEIQGVRRDGSTLASKAASIATAILNSPDSPNLLPAIALIRSVLLALPASCRHQMTNIELALATIVSGKAPKAGEGTTGRAPPTLKLRLEAAGALAQLPRAVGDAECWSKLARRVLCSVHDCMEVLLIGLDDAGLAARCTDVLLPTVDTQAFEPLLPALAAEAKAATSGGPPPNRLRPYLDTLLALLAVVEGMMVGSYPVPVPLPSQAVLLAAMRMLSADVASALAVTTESGKSLPALRGKALPPSQAMLLELHTLTPELHRVAWALVGLVFRSCAARSTLVPLHGTATKLLRLHLRRMQARGMSALAACGPLERQALYAAAEAVIQSSGIGVARPLAPEVLGAAMVEIYGVAPAQSGVKGGGTRGAAEPSKKKAKMSSGALPTQDANAMAVGLASEGGGDVELMTQAAAMSMLRSVVTVAGAMLPGEKHYQPR